MTVSDRIRQLNQKIRGWINYFSICDMKMAMKEIDQHLRTRLRVIIWKQWKVPSKRQWGSTKTWDRKRPSKTDIVSRKSYQWIATKTCVVRAISKRILAKKGLVSCLDYYILRHNLKIKTNRLVPNGMLGWCERVRKFTLLDWRKCSFLCRAQSIRAKSWQMYAGLFCVPF